MRKIAVILAHNIRNAGMYSVDLAAAENFPSGTDFFSERAYPSGAYLPKSPVHQYRGAGDLQGYSDVVFWGDFTTSIHYGISDYRRPFRSRATWPTRKLLSGRRFDALFEKQWFEEWKSKYLPFSSEIRFHSVAQNFQIRNDAIDDLMNENIEKYKSFDTIITRDRVSSKYLEELGLSNVTSSCDAAFFTPLPRRTQTKRSGRKKVGIFLFRSGLENQHDLEKIITKQIDVEITRFPEWLKNNRNVRENYQICINLMRDCDAIISDTYHFLINSINLGVPTIGVGKYCSTQTTTISDFKKSVLFDELGIKDNFYTVSPPKISERSLRDLVGMTARQLEASSMKAAPDKHAIHSFLEAIRTPENRSQSSHWDKRR